MKRLFSILSVATVVFALAGCQEKNVEPFEPENEGSTFELLADIIQTKTTLDGFKVDWDADDVLYMVTSGNDAWSTAQEFTYTDTDNRFVTKSTLTEEGDYTVNAIYCEDSQAEFHTNTTTTHKLQAVQNQSGATTTHIQNNDALVGQFEVTIPMEEAASVNMAHIYTMMEVDVKNNTGAEIEIVKFEMTASDADLAGVFTVSFDTPGVTYKSSSSETITVNVTDGTVAQDGSFPVYFVMAPLSDYSGDVTFKVTDASGRTYTKTVTLSGISFEAGNYNKTPYAIKDADPSVTWDLTKDSYSSAAADKVTWTSEYVNLSLEKGKSSSNANNYLGGGTNSHTRVYKDHVMTFAPVGKYQIDKIEYFVTETSYVDELTNSTWTNANVSSSGSTVTVIPDNGHTDVSVTIGAATRFTAITVYYSLDEDYVLPTVESLVVSGQTTEFVQNASFSFDGKVTAIYTDGKEVDVTDNVTVSTPDLTTLGAKEVTVTYMDGETPVTATYVITVIEESALSGWVLTSFANLKTGDQVVIVSTNGDSKYAISNNNGTGNAPTAVEITYSNKKLSEEPEDILKWSIEVSDDKYIFHSNSDNTNWLYCTNTNNGVRVGTNPDNKFFVLDADSGYLKNVATSRFLGVYNSQDWRCYTNTTGNIVGQTFQFFVKVGEN